MQVLLEAGSDVDRACEGSPSLHIAVAQGQMAHRRTFAAQAVSLLLEHGALAYSRWAGRLRVAADDCVCVSSTQ